MEDQALEVMEQVDLATKTVTNLESELIRLETEWQTQQKKLAADAEQLQITIAETKHKREMLAGDIDPQAVEVYQELKRLRGTAVAKVEQGICRGCRISLPVTELQQVRSGNLIRCSSCGRILFLA